MDARPSSTDAGVANRRTALELRRARNDAMRALRDAREREAAIRPGDHLLRAVQFHLGARERCTRLRIAGHVVDAQDVLASPVWGGSFTPTGGQA